MPETTFYTVEKGTVGEKEERLGYFSTLAEAREEAKAALGVPLKGRLAKEEKSEHLLGQGIVWMKTYIQPVKRFKEALLGEIPANVVIVKFVD